MCERSSDACLCDLPGQQTGSRQDKKRGLFVSDALSLPAMQNNGYDSDAYGRQNPAQNLSAGDLPAEIRSLWNEDMKKEEQLKVKNAPKNAQDALQSTKSSK